MRKKSRSRRHDKTKRNQPNPISSPEDAQSQQPNTISSSEHGVKDSTAVSDADEIDNRSYTPLSFNLDSAANHPGPIRKGYRRGIPSSESMIAASIGKNPIPLSSYTTNLVYHPAESTMDIFLDPISESKVDIFLDPNGESIMDVFVNSMGDSTTERHALSMSESMMGIRIDPKMDIFRPLSFFIDPSVCFTGHKNYIPLSMHSTNAPVDIESNSSQSNSSFGFSSHSSSESNSESKVSKDYSPLWFYTTASQMENAESSKSKVSRNYIPQEIAFSILSKLSVKSLKRFGCVCKSWSILFQNTHFMTMYSNHFLSRHGSHDHYHTFILANQHFFDDDNCYYYQSEFHLLENRLKFNLPSPLQQYGTDTCILGSTSVNGIFCLGQMNFQNVNEWEFQYVLWNPPTEEFMVIPSSPTQLTPKDPTGFALLPEPVFHGFVYDQLRDDFKVIQYVSFYDEPYPRHETSFFEIYSLNSNSWRRINMENDLSHWCYAHSGSFSSLEVYADGVCHWLVSDSINHLHAMTLLSFHLSDEVFLTTPIGEEPYSPYTFHGRLMQLNGSIALVSNYHDDIVFHIYILGELGVSESWIKLYTYGPLPSIQWPPIGFGKMGYIYVTTKDCEVTYVDLNTQIIEEVGINGGKRSKLIIEEVGITGEKGSKFIACLYQESLTSN